jgi:hypothetical protein
MACASRLHSVLCYVGKQAYYNSGTCPMCHSEAEDVKHALFACSHARQVWSALEQEIESLLAVDRSGSIVIQEAIRRGGRAMHWNNIGLAELILTGCWYIWWQQRQSVHGEDIQSPPRSTLSIAAITTNYNWHQRKPLR